MYPALIEKREITDKKVNLKQDLFCKIYATDPDVIGNAHKAYQKAYKCNSIDTAKSGARQLLEKPQIMARINEYLSQDGFNNESVDKKHNFLIHQHKDLNVSLKAIQEYNKLKKRVTDRLEISIPKPILDIDDDETNIKHIDKKRAVDVQFEETMVKYDDDNG